MLFAISLILLSSWSTIMAQHDVIFQRAYNCSPDSKIIVDYTYSNESKVVYGYLTITETIEASFNLQISVIAQHMAPNNSLLKSLSLNISRTNLCNFINTDMTYLPYIRQIAYFERFCPIPKKRYLLQGTTLRLKNQLIYPEGCWHLKLNVEKQGNLFAFVEDDDTNGKEVEEAHMNGTFVLQEQQGAQIIQSFTNTLV